MKIFFIASVIPRKPHDTRAPNVVVNEAIEAFVQNGHAVCLQLIFAETRRSFTEAEEANLRRLRTEFGVVMPPPLWKDDIRRHASDRLRRALGLNYGLQRFYPFADLGPMVEERVRANQCDTVFSLWSPPALPAAADIRGVPKGIYYGNLDYKPAETRLAHPELFDRPQPGFFKRLKERFKQNAHRKWHFRLMQKYDLVWNVCDVDAQILRENGVPQSQYIQNMWPIPPEADYAGQRRQREKLKALKICASIGGLQGTANTYGLHFIGRELAPLLAAELGPENVELHVYGARQPTRAVQAALRHPIIKVRGFVDDIDSEMLESPIFLMCNNCGHYKAGHTRFLHAWSLSACVIAHSENLATMPELEHGRNVLLAANAAEFAAAIKQASRDQSLRETIGHGGRETFVEHFAPRVVAGKLAAQMQARCNQPETNHAAAH